MSLTYAELCAGYGGLGRAVEEVFGAELRWYSEIDRAPSAIMAHHWPDVPNLGDMTAIDWAAVEPVDILSGGTPCQDISHAGRRKGMREGTRSNLWVAMREAIAVMRPRFVVWENVRGAYSAGADSDLEHCPGCMGTPGDGKRVLRALGRVLGDLSALGYDVQWRGLRAADVGAPHARFRVFILASHGDGAGRGEHGRGLAIQAEHASAECAGDDARAAAADAGSEARDLGTGLREGDAAGLRWERFTDDGATSSAAIASGVGRREGWAEHARIQGGPNAVLGGVSAPADDDGARFHRVPEPDGEPEAGLEASHGLDAHGRGDAAPDSIGHGRERWRRHEDVAGAPGTCEVEGDQRQWHGVTAHDCGPHDPGIDWGDYGPAIRQWEAITGRRAPAPTAPTGRNGGERLSAAFTEWMMGQPAGWVTDPAIGISRSEQLKACGNGVVTQQAVAALVDMVAA